MDGGVKDDVPTKKGPSATFLGSALLVVACASAITVLAVPRPVAPTELPPLVLSASDVNRVLREDERLAHTAPDDLHARALVTLMHAQGQAEVTPGETPADAMQRESNLRAVVNDVRASSGESGLKALRASAVQELLAVFERHEDDLETDRVLGSFPRILERYGLTVDGRLVAPIFVVRTLYKARWNSICRLEPTYALTNVEKRAFYGWLALAAHGAPPRERAVALTNYQRAGGIRGEEALGVLAYTDHEFSRAEEIFRHSYVTTRNVRYRNHALAAATAP